MNTDPMRYPPRRNHMSVKRRMNIFSNNRFKDNHWKSEVDIVEFFEDNAKRLQISAGLIFQQIPNRHS